MGNYKFNLVLKSYIKDVNLIMICFDVSDDNGFYSIDKWIKLCNEAAPETPIVLIATKIDLRGEISEAGKVRFNCSSKEEGRNKAKQLFRKYFIKKTHLNEILLK